MVAKNRVGETNMDTRLEVVTEEPGFIAPLKDCQTKLGNTETFECVVKVSGFRDSFKLQNVEMFRQRACRGPRLRGRAGIRS